ncbi:hypothetical protein BDV26DRAFT_298262 [Aspergillus bertholletiae]|uniref:Uncharacterized protein n=1 Tax=Aspergillus bertholletiae TaxID=1226010 RepID=A0A5N7ARR6_9EURO|nr:hypothetical protein BDV26DRAFT_298262 [Aspergillus bertholletiae]
MKIQILYSLAAVGGLVFANPIHNLEKRSYPEDVIRCIAEEVKQGLGNVCDVVSVACGELGGVDSLTSCITNAATEVTDITVITEDPLAWLQSVNCGQELLGGVQNGDDLIYKLKERVSYISQTMGKTVGNAAACLR